MAKVPIERQIMAVADLIEHATKHEYEYDKEAADAALRTMEFAKANRRHFELAALIAKDDAIASVEREFPGAQIVAVRRREEQGDE